MRLTKNQFLKAFAATVVLLAVVRAVFPSIAKPADAKKKTENKEQDINEDAERHAHAAAQPVDGKLAKLKFFKADGTPVKNRIRSVPNYSKAFPDLNDVQLEVANKYGVKPVVDREEAENRKTELVYMASRP